jgi:hypothetical protein
LVLFDTDIILSVDAVRSAQQMTRVRRTRGPRSAWRI